MICFPMLPVWWSKMNIKYIIILVRCELLLKTFHCIVVCNLTNLTTISFKKSPVCSQFRARLYSSHVYIYSPHSRNAKLQNWKLTHKKHFVCRFISNGYKTGTPVLSNCSHTWQQRTALSMFETSLTMSVKSEKRKYEINFANNTACHSLLKAATNYRWNNHFHELVLRNNVTVIVAMNRNKK